MKEGAFVFEEVVKGFDTREKNIIGDVGEANFEVKIWEREKFRKRGLNFVE